MEWVTQSSNHFTGWGKALEVGKCVFVTDKYFLSICYFSTPIGVTGAQNASDTRVSIMSKYYGIHLGHIS